MKDADRRSVRRLYDDMAEQYAEIMAAEIQTPRYREALAAFWRRVAAVEGPIVDTSSGTGHMLQHLGDLGARDRSLIGIDLSPAMLESARERDRHGVDYRLGDMTDLSGQALEPCAGLLSYFALHHLRENDVSKALDEWFRALAPGGQFLLAAWEGSGTIEYPGGEAVLAWKVPEDALRTLLGEAGFRILSFEPAFEEDLQMNALYVAAER